MVWAILMLGKQDTPMFLYLLNVYGMFTPGIATMFLLGILWKRTTQWGALAAGVLTIPLTLFLNWLTGGLNVPCLAAPHLPDVVRQASEPVHEPDRRRFLDLHARLCRGEPADETAVSGAS